MTPSAALLDDRGTVAVFGREAKNFLQNIVTCDVDKLEPYTASLGALLTPQGKIIADFLLVRDDGEGFLIDMTRALAPEFVERLSRYRLRAKVEISDLSEQFAVAALWGGAAEPEEGLAYADPRPGELGRRAFLPRGEAQALLAKAGYGLVEADSYHERRVKALIPEGGKDYILGDTFPHEADFDGLGGADFTKGCYIGQEVVSRMEHRTNTRKRVVGIKFAHARPVAGAEIRAGGRVIGYAGTAIIGQGLAMLRLDHAAEALAKGEPLIAGGIAVTPFKPAWAKFDMGGTAA